ncbi:hypothetical protein BFP77_04410 [Maribacter sp. 4U21]|uniref:hypothetical protein n=1 Tax=Maribacter sp. 4U21 TaxID=1889779 RepID=UPI000C14EA70|nr:hypothetical protein [Maribacter sp. 4U21]PIB30496.1 hypothetical protein BFP77_04410 [Maribacter sp. 4U21]
MPKYLIKFTPKEFYPDFSDLTNYNIKLGTFHHYRNIENSILSDKSEGQRGLTLRIKKPCPKLEQLSKEEGSYITYDKSSLNEKGEFKAEFYLQLHDHLLEFNAWLFCCSHVDDLEYINTLKEHFKCESYFFIYDVDKFVNSIQRALSDDLKANPLNENNEERVIYEKGGNVFIDGYKDAVRYSDKSKWMNRECETLTQFIESKKSREVDQNLWFQKPKRYITEQEVRFIYFPTAGRTERKRFNIRDDFKILGSDFSDCISEEPKSYE